MDTKILELIQEYDLSVGKAPLSKGKAWISRLLKELRASKLRRPDVVLNCGKHLIDYESNIEVWNLREQIAVAAMEVGQLKLADVTISVLKTKFPNSNRVKRLQGMLFEAQGNYDSAQALYEEILAKDIMNISIMKRLICIKKAKGDCKGTVEGLNRLLQLFPGDVGSWIQLSDIYLTLCDCSAAAHCLEELVLLDHRNAHYHCRLAEVYYSIGGVEKIVLARKQYSISLSLQGPQFNLRAIYGMIACCKQLTEIYKSMSHLSSPSSSSGLNTAEQQEKRLNMELYNWAREQLDEISEKSPSVGIVAKAIL